MNMASDIKPLQSMPVIIRDDWIIKSSILNKCYILMVVQSSRTGQVLVRWFGSQAEAGAFMEFLSEKGAQEVIQIFHEQQGELT